MTSLRSFAVWTLLCGSAGAQWLKLPTPGMPRTPDGKPNLTAPAPRTADGKPDLSGLWRRDTDKYANNIAADAKPGQVVPAAEALYQRRKLDFGKDSMAVKCQPFGPAYATSPYQEARVVQTPTLIVFLNNDLTHREIFLDGRTLEQDPNPTWMGYSVGHWEGDTLVVESNGYDDRTWLDGDGHPHSEALRMTERFFRRDFGHIDIQVTFQDPQVFTAPLTVSLGMDFEPDTEMLEFACENERDAAHMVSGVSEKPVQLAPDVLARYSGLYEVVDPRAKPHKVEVAVADGALLIDYDGQGRQALTPYSPTRFSMAGTWIEFSEGAGASMNILIRYVEGDERGPRKSR